MGNWPVEHDAREYRSGTDRHLSQGRFAPAEKGRHGDGCGGNDCWLGTLKAGYVRTIKRIGNIVDVTVRSSAPQGTLRRYFQHAHYIPIVGVGEKVEYQLVHGDLPRQHSFETTLRFTGPVPADSRQ